MKKIFVVITVVLLIFIVFSFFWINQSNDFKRDGKYEISFNENPIEIIRDGNGIAYVIADSKADAYRGQGFVLAQDRLFQIELYRALIKGEGASITGSSMLDSDIKMRVLDIYGNAKKTYKYLDDDAKKVLNWYCQGFNEYLKVGKVEFPIELNLLDIQPKDLEPIDIISVLHFIGFFHSQNIDDEILSHNLSASSPIAEKLLPLSVNLDRTRPLKHFQDSLKAITKELILKFKKEVASTMVSYPDFGSNNWAISAEKSKTGKPILCNDPHVDARILPGTFYPIGIICPDFKAVGIATPGIPGLLSGRNEFVSFGVTNAYGDSQDLFIEKIEGDNYIQDGLEKPLKIRKEIINVKDSTSIELVIRSTERGPIISDFDVFNVQTTDDLSLRWSIAESKSPSFGFEKLLDSRSAEEFRENLYGMDLNFFNYAIADIYGNIAHQSTGLVPLRPLSQGEVPVMASKANDWIGFIPKSEMPHMINPDRNWIGTANHDTRPDDYPYYYSNHFSPFYRYKRLKQAFDNQNTHDPDEMWALILDVKNTQAELFVPIFVDALSKNESTKEIAVILKSWNLKDAKDEVGATLYNTIYNELLYLVLDDELPDNLETQYWENVYYWNQRVDSLILKNDKIIDDISTEKIETLSDMIVEAASNSKEILTERLGSNMNDWTWGRIHNIHFVSPLKQGGFGSGLLGGELLPKAGSNQTLNRGAFIKNKNHNFETTWFSSFRMMADMSDDEKIRGVVSGGSAARVFHPYYKSQLETWKNEDWLPYWFSLEKIREHGVHSLILE